MSKTFLIMAGGTGGHVYPALGFAQLAQQRGHRVSWLGTETGLEARIVPEKGIDLNVVDIAGVRGKGVKSLLAAPFKILKAVLQSLSVLKGVRPDLVIGFGGYTAGPGGVASKLAGLPLVIHEQNAIAGTTNKLLSKIASKVLCAFEGALPKSEIVGNPVRAEILNLDQYRTGRADDAEPCNLLILGGSLGARFLNESVPQALAKLPLASRPKVRHQAGPKLLDEARDSYAQMAVDAEITAYIEDMAEAYAWADLVVCRAGAMTVSELAVVGLPALFVPFPYAIDDHQTANAQWLQESGAAVIYQQREENPEHFAELLQGLMESKQSLKEMAERARGRGIRNSTERILDICEELANVA